MAEFDLTSVNPATITEANTTTSEKYSTSNVTSVIKQPLRSNRVYLSSPTIIGPTPITTQPPPLYSVTAGQLSSSPITTIIDAVVPSLPYYIPSHVGGDSESDTNSIITVHDSTSTSVVVDLTNDNSDSIIDLTSPTDPDMPKPSQHITNNHYRPCCKFEKPPTSPDVVLIDSVPHHKSSRKSKTKKFSKHQSSPVSSPYSVDDRQTLKNGSTIKCPICLETSAQFEKSGSKLVSTICGHLFCSQCIRNSITSMHKCPTCRRKLTLKQYHQIFL